MTTTSETLFNLIEKKPIVPSEKEINENLIVELYSK